MSARDVATVEGSAGGGGVRAVSGAEGVRLGAVELAALLGTNRPTAEQIAVIEAPLEPLLVVAGAGSGKTATMTDRVVWLVANGLVEPAEVLGLTFTRKAAAELASRVEKRLRLLARELPELFGPADSGVDWVTQRPRISTYNAYAAALVQDHGLRLGIEADLTLLTEAGRLQLASEVVDRWAGQLDTPLAVSTVVGAVASLAGEMSEHLLDPDAVARRLREIALELASAEPAGSKRAPYADVQKVIDSLEARAQLMPLIAEMQRLKRERGAIDFADQVAAAARLGREFPLVAARERETARVVLLDEYQDTSVAQLEMLRGLFGDGHPVTAVGDPHQGIYGWRGASAGSLLSFPEHFPRADGEPARLATLSTSWRNDEAILAAANETSAPLRASTRLAVPELRARPGAGSGEVRWLYAADTEAETAAMARAIAQRWRPGHGTAAVLCRKRAWFEPLRAAFAALGVPAQVVGLAGLLETPAVSDVRAALTAAFDPSRGDALARLLTGPAFRLGIADLLALQSLARERTAGRGDGAGRREEAENASIVEALDVLPEPGWRAGDGRELSAAGHARLVEARTLVRQIRSLAHLGLADLVVAVEQLLGLDLELVAHGGAGRRGRADLDELVDVAADFEAGATAPTLGGFLAYLDAAQEHERGLDVPAGEPDPARVQILTMHAAKGLEWSVVGVVGLAEKEFPGLGGSVDEPTSSGWLTALDALPYELRGDADHLPDLGGEPGATHRDVDEARERFRVEDGARALREERRLAYVAFTRAERSLVLSGSWWSTRKEPDAPSRFLLALVREGLAQPVDGVEPGVLDGPPERPESAASRPVVWPVEQDPDETAALRRAQRMVELADPVDLAIPGRAGDPEAPDRDPAAAERSSVAPGAPVGPGAPDDRAAGAPDDRAAAVAGVPSPPPVTWGDAGEDALVARWRWEAGALLAERDLASGGRIVTAPEHLSASAVVALASDPETFARDRRRPMPTPPRAAARRGTRFHAWLERHYSRAALIDVDELVGEEIGSDEELEALREAFLASPWAQREPIAIEEDVTTPVAGVEIRCRIDAVFPGGPGEDCDVHIVDWKTGHEPAGERARRARELQLAMYRLGWSRLHGIRLERIAASFHYVGEGVTLAAPRLGEEEVTDLLERHLAELASLGSGGSG
ncbi:UvrD-helicase domain-containing protein [Salana multivorans]|uniref:UvrD-helicase domain-containing protein n=1 Tax=Salana multivorans TaxID=120377 RepID=UPI000AD3F1F1|nr:UvrD-helicase domain-containing protein [Salana multivorans]